MFRDLFEQWKQTSTVVAKLQWLYLAAGGVLLVAAGLVALLNQAASRRVVSAAGLLFVVFLVNVLMLSAVNELLASRSVQSQLPARPTRRGNGRTPRS